MASHLDLEEQEQLDQIKSFWAQWGNLITGVVTLGLVCFAAWNGWNYWQQRQATQAAVLFDTFEEAKNFINEMVLPDYNYWVGEEDYI